jgi:transposase
MSKPERRTFTKEFKLDVIQQSYHRENIRELANELGLRVELIYKWRARYQDSPMQSFPGKGVEALTPQEQKLRALQKENAELRTERDILKKAIGIFGKTNG